MRLDHLLIVTAHIGGVTAQLLLALRLGTATTLAKALVDRPRVGGLLLQAFLPQLQVTADVVVTKVTGPVYWLCFAGLTGEDLFIGTSMVCTLHDRLRLVAVVAAEN